MDRETNACPPTLNPAQYELWASEPDAARRAVDAIVAELGPIAPDEVMQSIASLGTLEAAASFDAARGLPYGQWAFYFASFRLWEQLRKEHGQDKPTLARIRKAMFHFMAHHHRFFDVWNDTRESDTRALRSFTDGMLFAGALQMGAPTTITRGVEDVVAAEGARATGDAVRQVVGELRPEQRDMLRQCAAYGEPVKAYAKQLGRGYRGVLDDYHELIALCGARLHGLLGTTGMPEWHADISGRVFEDPPDPANDGDGGRGG